ncbi:MAG: KilA-N domain-containing protein [Lachnospiraceae bacterium]|nr:KilA-N domain-containing protein [Lachnospiraceae bacterium]
MAKNRIITVQNIPVTVSFEDTDDYICITDMAAAKSDNSRAADVIKNWIRSRNTLEFLGTWEQIYNPDFKVVEFDHFKQEAGLHTFTLSVTDWVDSTDAARKFCKPDEQMVNTCVHNLN